MSAAAQSDVRACADCGFSTYGKFCPACGQKASLDRTVGAMVSNLLHDVAHLDGKLLRTLPLLAFRPGVLTRRYIDGMRTRYVGPNAIFLASAFVMFLAFNLLPGPSTTTICDIAANGAIHRAGDAVRSELEELGPTVGALLPPTTPTGLSPAAAWIEQHMPADMLVHLEAALRNPEITLMKVKQKAYKLGFLLIPLSLPALWVLLGGRPGVRLYDLAVFALYSVGFMSFLLTAVVLLAGTRLLGWPLYAALLLSVPPAHFYVHLRDSFALTAFESIWRTAILSAVAVMSLTFFLALILYWGVLA